MPSSAWSRGPVGRSLARLGRLLGGGAVRAATSTSRRTAAIEVVVTSRERGRDEAAILETAVRLRQGQSIHSGGRVPADLSYHRFLHSSSGKRTTGEQWRPSEGG